MKRLTQIISDEPNKELHSGKFGSYNSRKFNTEDTSYDDNIEMVLGMNVWAKLGSPHNIKVTITVVE
jgi:hypothetical protein